MKEEVLKLLSNSNVAIASTERNYVSFTSNAWSSDVNDTSLLSLLAHWIAVLEITVSHWPFLTNFSIWPTKIYFDWPYFP